MLSPLTRLLAALVLCCAAGTYIHAYGQSLYYNSDWLFLEALYRDLFLEQGSLADWSLPPAPYYVEMPLYFALRWLGGNMHFALAAFAACQIVLLIIALACVFHALLPVPKKAVQKAPFHIARLSSAMLILFLATRGSGLFLYLNTNNAHVLTFVLSLFGLSLVLSLIQPKNTGKALRRRVLTSVLLGCAATTSDLFYLVWFVLPMLLCLGIFYLGAQSRTRRRCLRRAALTLSLGALSGIVLEWAVRVQPRYGIEAIRPGLDFLLNGWRSMAEPAAWHFASPLNSALLLAGVVGALLLAFSRTDETCQKNPKKQTGQKGQACSMLQKALTVPSPQPARLLGLFLLLSLPVTLLIIYVNGYAEVSRYYLGSVFYLCLLGLPWLLDRFSCLLKAAQCLILMAAIPLCVFFAFFNTSLRPPLYPPLVSCVDQLAERWNAHSGMAGYWDARYISLLSRTGLFVESTTASGRFRNPYMNPVRPRRDRYELVIADPYTPTHIPGQELDADLIQRLHGRPDALAFCPGLDGTAAGAQVLLYKKGLSLPQWPQKTHQSGL